MKIYIFVRVIKHSEKYMDRLEEILSMEIKGISKTIYDYTNDNFIRSYAEELLNIEMPKDKIKLKLLVKRLVDWYSVEYESIKKEKYLFNVDSHTRSIGFLKEIYELL